MAAAETSILVLVVDIPVVEDLMGMTLLMVKMVVKDYSVREELWMYAVRTSFEGHRQILSHTNATLVRKHTRRNTKNKLVLNVPLTASSIHTHWSSTSSSIKTHCWLVVSSLEFHCPFAATRKDRAPNTSIAMSAPITQGERVSCPFLAINGYQDPKVDPKYTSDRGDAGAILQDAESD